MIRRNTFLTIYFLLTVFVTFSFAQQNELKQYVDKTLGGECTLKSSTLHVDGQTSMKTFEIEVPADGEYYLAAWVMNTGITHKNNGLKFFVDDQKTQTGNLNPQKEGWQCAELLDNSNTKTEKLSLTAGVHNLTFCSTVPEVPPVEFIRLSRTESGAEISEVEWTNYIETAKKNILPLEYAKLAEDSLNNGKLLRTLPNPNGDYLHQIDINFTYTYYTTMYFYAGANVVLETKKADPYSSNPVMHFFNADDPVNRGSWGDDNGGEGMQAKITCTVQYTGYYYVLVRSFWPNTVETSDLYLYDNLYASNIAIAGTGFRCDHTLTQEINYFTSFLTGDSRLWVESYETGLNGRILGYNDDYYGSGDFSWVYNARVKKSYSQRMWNCFVSRYSSNNPTGHCDLYMRCKNSTIMSYFPNLKADDAIMSAPASYTYNCISWSGGITSYWEWPLDPGSRYYVSGNPLASFDNYYANTPPRYTGCNWVYTRTGANSSNNQIDLWALNGTYTHASVNARWDNIPRGNPANDNPHGYDWESKPGSLMRTFHPRYALSGSSYGNVDKYYKEINVLAKLSTEYITSEESIRRGLSKLDNVALNESELSKIASLKMAIDHKELQEFNNTYANWKATWTSPEISIYSNPRKYAESDEYAEFFNYCVSKGKEVLPLILEKLNQGDLFVIVPLEDLTYIGNEKLMEDIHKENLENQYTKDGVFIIHTLLGNWLKYGQKLLDNFEEYKGFTPQTKESNLQQSLNVPKDRVVIQNYPNPFNPTTQIKYGIPSNSKVTVKIYDVLGKEIVTLVNNELQAAGWHNTNWDGRNINGNAVSSGIYFCRISSNSQVSTIKLMLVR